MGGPLAANGGFWAATAALAAAAVSFSATVMLRVHSLISIKVHMHVIRLLKPEIIAISRTGYMQHKGRVVMLSPA